MNKNESCQTQGFNFFTEGIEPRTIFTSAQKPWLRSDSVHFGGGTDAGDMPTSTDEILIPRCGYGGFWLLNVSNPFSTRPSYRNFSQ